MIAVLLTRPPPSWLERVLRGFVGFFSAACVPLIVLMFILSTGGGFGSNLLVAVVALLVWFAAMGIVLWALYCSINPVGAKQLVGGSSLLYYGTLYGMTGIYGAGILWWVR
jgi:hypothetical protein